MTNNSSSVAAQQALDNAVKQTTASLKAQTLEMQKAALAMRDYNKAAGLAGTTGKAEAVSLKASNAERGKSVQLLGKETQARQSSLAEQTIADMDRALALSGKTSAADKMVYETSRGKFAGEDEGTKNMLMSAARETDWNDEESARRAYINSVTGKNPERDAENARKLGWARDEYARGGLTDTQLYKQERELGKKDDPDFMTKLIDSLTDSAREGAGKIQDILGTRMYDFVSDKFNKMGLSFLNSVAKMVSSAASAKLMDLMFGDFTKGGPLGGLLGDIGGFFGDIGNSVMGLFGFGSQPVAQAFPVKFATGGAFTNGIVSRATAFPMGLMGEAGPEAVMPLHRGADGSLGIRASFAGLPQDSDAGTGAGGVAVNVYVQDGNVSASSDSGEPGWKQFGQQIGEYVTQLVDRRMSQSYRQGGLAWQASNNRLGA